MITIILFLAILLIMIYLSWDISLGIYLKSYCKNKNAHKAFALTLDDGVDPVNTPKVLNILAKHNAKATFFIIGDNAMKHPEIVRMIVAEGHEIGNHSMHHHWSFPMQNTAKITNEINNCTAILEQITNTKIKYFRPPFGVTNPMIGKAVRQSSLTSIAWSIRSYDTVKTDKKKIENKIMCQLKGGDIILLHDRLNDTDILLDNILTKTKERGYYTLTITELINENNCA